MFTNTIYPLGLDINDESIKIIQLVERVDKIKIQAISKISLPHGTIVNGEIMQKENLVKAIKEAIGSPVAGKFTTDEVVVNLPEQKTFIKLIEIEKTPNDLANVIETEMEKHIPLQVNDIYYDWQVIKNLPTSQMILIGAAPQKIVDDYASIIEQAGLSIAAMEIESVCLCRSLLPEENSKIKDKKNNYAILNIGSSKTNLIVYAQGTIIFTFSMPIAGKDLTEKIAQLLELNAEQAEKAKSVCGFTENKAQGIIKNILSDSIDDLINKINEAIEFYQNHFSSFGPINKIILCGSDACLQDLDKIIFLKTKIPAIVGDITINLSSHHDKLFIMLKEKQCVNINLVGNNKKINGNLNTNTENTITYATAIGLALRGIFINDY